MKKIVMYQKATCGTCRKELIYLMLIDPNLIKRPILVDGARVFFGYAEL